MLLAKAKNLPHTPAAGVSIHWISLGVMLSATPESLVVCVSWAKAPLAFQLVGTISEIVQLGIISVISTKWSSICWPLLKHAVFALFITCSTLR